MIISTIKHAVQTHETQQMAPVNRSESLFSVRIPRSKVHATRDTLRLPRKPIETLTRDTRRARVQCTKNRTEERERGREMKEIGFVVEQLSLTLNTLRYARPLPVEIERHAEVPWTAVNF